MYGVIAYYNAKTFAELPLNIVAPFLMIVIIYFAMGLTATFTQFILCYFTIFTQI